jgi:hypothetical protein
MTSLFMLLKEIVSAGCKKYTHHIKYNKWATCRIIYAITNRTYGYCWALNDKSLSEPNLQFVITMVKLWPLTDPLPVPGMTIKCVDCFWNVMAHAQKPDFVFRPNGRVHLNRRGLQFSRLLAGELCTSACRVCTARASLCSEVTWRLLVTYSILLFPCHFLSRTSPCAITFQLQSIDWRLTAKNTQCHCVDQCHHVDQKSHTDCAGREAGRQHYVAGHWHTELCHGYQQRLETSWQLSYLLRFLFGLVFRTERLCFRFSLSSHQ